MTPARPGRGEAGFTLLEMLVVLVLLALLAATLTGLIYFGISARARLTAMAQDQADLLDVTLVLHQTLGRAEPETLTNSQTGGIDFAGRTDQMAFLAPALDAQGPGLALVRLFLAQAGGKPVIRLQTRLDARPPGPWLTADFAPGLAALDIQYFGANADGTALVWQNSWLGRAAAPELVSITVRFPPGDRRNWPVLIIHPQIGADAACQIDPGTHRCAAP